MRLLPCALLIMSSLLTAAQEKKEKWQRVYTGEDSTIEIDISKVTFVENNVPGKVTFDYNTGRVGFRTSFSKPEALQEKPGVKYKSRVETIDFNCATNRYRSHEASLLDEKGKVIKTFEWDPSAEWKEIKRGGMMDKLSVAACTLISEKRRTQ